MSAAWGWVIRFFSFNRFFATTVVFMVAVIVVRYFFDFTVFLKSEWIEHFYKEITSGKAFGEFVREIAALAVLVFLFDSRHDSLKKRSERLQELQNSFGRAQAEIEVAVREAADPNVPIIQIHVGRMLNALNMVTSHHEWVRTHKMGSVWIRQFNKLEDSALVLRDFGSVLPVPETSETRTGYVTVLTKFEKQFQFFKIELIDKALD